jgi:hypothetical protein
MKLANSVKVDDDGLTAWRACALAPGRLFT